MFKAEQFTCSKIWALLLSYKEFRFPEQFVRREVGEQGKDPKKMKPDRGGTASCAESELSDSAGNRGNHKGFYAGAAIIEVIDSS